MTSNDRLKNEYYKGNKSDRFVCPRGVIFDADGTLLDSMPIWENAGARYLRTLGVEAEPELDSIVFPMTMDQSCAYIREHYHLKQSPEEVIWGIHAAIRDFYYEEAPLKGGAGELLERFRQYHIPMVVATTSEREHIEAAFRRLGILDYFVQIITAREIGSGKHQPDIYLAAAGELCRHAEINDHSRIWVFEDVGYAVETAKRAGFFTVGIYDAVSDKFQASIADAADYFITDFSEIKF